MWGPPEISNLIVQLAYCTTRNSWPRWLLRPIHPIFNVYRRLFTKGHFGLRVKQARGKCWLYPCLQHCRKSRCTAPGIHSLVTRKMCVQIYCTTVLHASTEPPVPIEQEEGCAPKPRCTLWTELLLPRGSNHKLSATQNHYHVTTMKDPSWFQHVTQTVLVR